MIHLRVKNAASVPERRPARLRLAAVVYAVVVILGLAGTGAHALWSQSGTAVASVSTGSWGPQPVTWTGCDARKDGRLGTDFLIVTFMTPVDADQVLVEVSGGTTSQATKDFTPGPSRAASAEFSVRSQWLSKQTFEVSLTPKYAGTSGASVVRTVELKMGLFGNVEASCK